MRRSGGGRQVVRLLQPAFLAALAVAVATPAFAAIWYEDYDKAERALRSENWAEAVQYLDQAVAARGESGVGVKTYGMNFIDYFPYLKLGIAHYQLGNYDAALTAFEREERLGEVSKSQRDVQELERYRGLAQQARDAAAETERSRLVAASLQQARALETQGRLEDAITEVNKALAVDPESSEANELLGRVQATLTRQQDQRDREARLATLLGDGRRLLGEKKYQEAAGILAQATQLDPNSTEAKNLLDQAQRELSAQLQAQKDAEELRSMVTDGLASARQFENAKEYAQAIAAIQSVLAVDPQNATAIEMRKRLLVAQDRSERDRVRGEGVQALLSQVEDRLGAEDFEGSLSLVSRALSIDPMNQPAFQMLQRVQRALRRQLIGTVGEGTLPPQISFLDDRREASGEEGELGVETVDYPNFKLNGAVYSSTMLAKLEYAVDGTSVELGNSGVELGDGQVLTQFQIDHTLASGKSTIHIVATDSSEKSVSREYSVLYQVPFYLSTWFYASLFAFAVVAVAGAYGRRVFVRRQKLKRRFNPYIAGAPVIQEGKFFGRDNLMHRVLQSVHNNSILLYGERRIGKTSFQHRLKKRLLDLKDPEYEFYPVYIDLQGTPEEKFFFTLGHEIFEELEPILDGTQPSEALQQGSSYDYRELVRDIRAVLHALKQRSSKKIKLALLIDEVDELNSYDPRVNQRLRSLFMKSFAEDLVAVVSGVGIKKHWESQGSPWYNFFEEIPVKPFRREDAVDLIERPIRGVFKLESGVTDRIITVTDGKPYLIQKLCVSLVNRLHEQHRRVITLTDVDSLGKPQVE